MHKISKETYDSALEHAAEGISYALHLVSGKSKRSCMARAWEEAQNIISTFCFCNSIDVVSTTRKVNEKK